MGDAYMFAPPTTLIVGGNGKVARHLTSLLTAADPAHVVWSIIRNRDQVPSLIALGAHPIVQDLVSGTIDNFIDIIERTRPDTVVWAASNPQAPFEVDRDGALKVIDALARAQIPKKRYIAISSADVRDRAKPTPDWYSDADVKLSDRMWGAIEPALRAKFEADKDLRINNRSRGLEYTIIRPGGLVEKEAEGTIRAGKVGLLGMITRADVAAVLFAALEDEWTTGMAFDILGSGEGGLPIKEAVRAVAAKREDTFDGYY